MELDHAIVPVRDRRAAAERLAAILGVPWAETGIGPFCPVFVSDGFTIDFDTAEGSFPIQHYAFRVSDAEFDAIVARLVDLRIGHPGARAARTTGASAATAAGASSTGTSRPATCGRP